MSAWIEMISDENADPRLKALLDKARQEPTAEMVAARKEAVSELYRTRVLGQRPTPQ